MIPSFGVKDIEERLQLYYENWLEKLIEEKIRFLYDTYSSSDNIVVLERVYQVYIDESIYLIKVVNHNIVSIRSIYERIGLNKSFLQTDFECDIIQYANTIEQIYEVLASKGNSI